MLLKPNGCKGCALEHSGTGFITSTGSGNNGVLLVDEFPSATEVEKGIPLIGIGGFTLGRALQRGKMKRDDFTIATTTRCQPPNNQLRGLPYEDAAIHHCSRYLADLVTTLRGSYPRDVVVPATTHPDGSLREPLRLRPRELVMVALGEIPLRALTDFAGIADCRGYVFRSHQYNCWVVPTLHPTFIAHGNVNLTGFLIEDIQKAIRIAEEGFSYEIIEPLLDPPVRRFDD